LQYVLRQQASPLRQSVSPARGLGAVAAAVVAARPDQSTSSVSQAADSTVQWPAATFDRLTDVVCVPHEVVQWPQDKQPKLGYITKNKLRKLTVRLAHSSTQLRQGFLCLRARFGKAILCASDKHFSAHEIQPSMHAALRALLTPACSLPRCISLPVFPSVIVFLCLCRLPGCAQSWPGCRPHPARASRRTSSTYCWHTSCTHTQQQEQQDQ
jgi:hypothetical protein